MSIVTRSMNKATHTPVKATPVKADALGKKSNTNKYNLRNTPSVDYADIRSDDDEKKGLEEEEEEKEEEEEEKEEEEEEEEEEDDFPLATLATRDELTGLNLTPGSKDPSGKYNIVAKATELEYTYVCRMGEHIQGKWAIAPPGYYWIQLSEKCYYWFDWVELRRIPV